MGLPGRVGYPMALLQLFIAVVLLFVGASEGATVDYEGELDLEEREEGKDLPRTSVTFSSYMSFSQVSSYLESLQGKYPNKVRVDEVGRSVENRPIYRVRITNNVGSNAEKKVVFIDGGIHAREWASPPAALYIIKKLIANKKLTRKIEWQIIPMLNPDGYVYTWNQDRLWRKNRSPSSVCVGVDLNRNFGYQWGGLGTSSNPCSNIYKGSSAFSEPESRALRDAMLPLDGRVQAYITFHAYGQYILYPWGYSTDVTHPLTASMNRAGKAMAKQIERKNQATYDVGNSAEAFYPAAGASDDWASYALNVPYVYTIELRDTGSYGFTLPASQILSTEAVDIIQFDPDHCNGRRSSQQQQQQQQRREADTQECQTEEPTGGSHSPQRVSE
ncbi:carboxypeptidase B-like [Macrobrachium nipponense]|uniref:carboxypeptidase B-like n=1 Tax=Macrobrachium nipponense TaxID=159736 RepID=UPI0030C7F75A